MVLASASSIVLIRFLAARDTLGHRHLTLTDDHGTELGHGDLDEEATAWTAHWTWTPPCLSIDPIRAPLTGGVTWNPEGARRLRAAGLPVDGLRWIGREHQVHDDWLEVVDPGHASAPASFGMMRIHPDDTGTIRLYRTNRDPDEFTVSVTLAR
jgi:hypothetical protein